MWLSDRGLKPCSDFTSLKYTTTIIAEQTNKQWIEPSEEKKKKKKEVLSDSLPPLFLGQTL